VIGAIQDVKMISKTPYHGVKKRTNM